MGVNSYESKLKSLKSLGKIEVPNLRFTSEVQYGADSSICVPH